MQTKRTTEPDWPWRRDPYAHLTNVKLWAWNRATTLYMLMCSEDDSRDNFDAYTQASNYLRIVAPELASPLAVAHGH